MFKSGNDSIRVEKTSLLDGWIMVCTFQLKYTQSQAFAIKLLVSGNTNDSFFLDDFPASFFFEKFSLKSF